MFACRLGFVEMPTAGTPVVVAAATAAAAAVAASGRVVEMFAGGIAVVVMFAVETSVGSIAS